MAGGARAGPRTSAVAAAERQWRRFFFFFTPDGGKNGGEAGDRQMWKLRREKTDPRECFTSSNFLAVGFSLF